MKEYIIPFMMAIIASGLITALVMRFFDRRKIKAEVKKTEIDTTKAAIEIEGMRAKQNLAAIEESQAVITSFATVATTMDSLLTQVKNLTQEVQEYATDKVLLHKALQECKESEAELKEEIERDKKNMKRQIEKIENDVALIKQQSGEQQ